MSSLPHLRVQGSGYGDVSQRSFSSSAWLSSYEQEKKKMSESQSELVRAASRVFDLQVVAMGAKVPNAIEQFLECFAENLVWRFPMGKYAGTHESKASFEEFFRYACNHFSTGLTFYLDRVLSDDKDTVAFEFHDEGLNPKGEPYKANVTIYYTMQNDKVTGYREYFG